ncbi:Collagen pro alpha-chain precursor [Pseudomonas avellanae BPIC 631]|nr:Collagen pro alpha-chain precursor [Pseudomonas avellanae BPIC 631]
MRKLVLLAALFSPLALAQTIIVAPHSLMRLPGNSSVLQVERLEVSDYGTLLIPAGIDDVKIGELVLGHEARIAIVPGVQAFNLVVLKGEFGTGSQITARGAPGTFEKLALPGRNLSLRLQSLNAEELSIDARGGAGSPGYAGLDGGTGEEPGCMWGQGGRGYNGDSGGNGRDGAAGSSGAATELSRRAHQSQCRRWRGRQGWRRRQGRQRRRIQRLHRLPRRWRQGRQSR